MYFNVNFNVIFKLIKVHLLVSELYLFHIAFMLLKDKVHMYYRLYTQPPYRRTS